jgi:hypothetical protein
MKSTTSYLSALSKLMGCCFLLLGTFTLHAQTRGKVEVVKDSRIDTLMARRLEPARSNAYTGGSGGGSISTDGYRVQFFSGSNRAEAYSAQERFNKRFPEMRTYISYREPNFKVRAGDFRTRLEATKFLQEVRSAFPTLFIIPEKINPPVQ